MGFQIPNSVPGGTAEQFAQAQLDSVDFATIVAGIGGTGVVSGGAVSPSGALVLAVASAVIAVAGVQTSLGSGSVTLSAANTVWPRFDLVTASVSGYASVSGVPALEPIFPAVPSGSVLLAPVYVAAGATVIGSADIGDRRVVPAAALSALATEIARAGTAETANTAAITSEASTARAAEALKAPLASPALTGVPTVPTATALTATTQAASTAYADAATAVEKARALAVEAVKADLVAGTVPRAQLPNITSVSTVSVASQAAMLALAPPDADTSLQAIRTDTPGTVYWLNPGLSPAVLGNWIQIADDISGAASAAQAFAIQRANHTGTQAESTVTGLVGDLAAKAPALTFTAVLTADTAVAANTYGLFDCSGGNRIATLPTAPPDGTRQGLKLSKGLAIASTAVNGALTTVTLTGAPATALTTGQVVPISGVTGAGATAANGTWPITVLTTTTFTIPVVTTGAGTGGTATAFTLSAACGGSDTIDLPGGATSAVVARVLNQAIIFQYKSSATSWVVVSSDLPLGQLDLRYQQAGTSVQIGGDLGGTPSVPTVPGLANKIPMHIGKRLVTLGDSLTAAGRDSQPNFIYTRDVWQWACMLSGGKLVYQRNAGVSGNTSAQMLARFATDVTPYSPHIVTIWGGTNDSSAAVTLAAFATNIRALVAAVRAINARPVILNVPPNAATGARRQLIETYNTWLRFYCAKENIIHIDTYGLMTDPATGGFLAAYDLDGTHENSAAAKLIGQSVANALTSITENWSPFLPVHATADAKNLLPNGLFLASASGLATGWTNTNGTPSIVTADPSISGNWQRLTDAGTAQSVIQCVVSTGFSAGDTLAFCGRIAQKVGSSTAAWQFWISSYDGTTATNTYVIASYPGDTGIPPDVNNGVFYQELVVPPATTSYTVYMTRTASVAGTGYSQIAQMGLYDLTALGVLAA